MLSAGPEQHGSPPDPSPTTPLRVLLLGAVLAYGMAGWAVLLRQLGLAGQAPDQSPDMRWLAVGTVALPLVIAAVGAVTAAVTRFAAGLSDGDGDRTAVLGRVMATALGASAAFALASPVYDYVSASDATY